MREEILESIDRMSKEDCLDVAATFSLPQITKAAIRKAALDNEDIAEYVLMY